MNWENFWNHLCEILFFIGKVLACILMVFVLFILSCLMVIFIFGDKVITTCAIAGAALSVGTVIAAIYFTWRDSL